MSAKAPDGKAWPIPRVAVDTREQSPWPLGWCARRGEDGALETVVDTQSLVTTLLGGPFPWQRATLATGDYQLMGPDDVPVDGWACVERKGADLVGSLTHDRDRFLRECERLARFRYPFLIAETSIEDLVAQREHRSQASARSLLGTLLSIAADHRIMVFQLPSREWAEYAAAWVLRRAWRRWLTEDAARLEAARKVESTDEQA